MNKIEQLKKNIKRQYTFVVLSNLGFTRGVWMIFLAARGLSLIELGLLESIFHVTSLLMEVPTGAIADIYGRRVSRILGRVIHIFSLIAMVSTFNFPVAIISFVLSALSYNLESGAGTALIYDSMKQTETEGDFLKVSGRTEFLYQTTSVAAFIIGGTLATFTHEWAFAAEILISLVVLVQSFTFVEPDVGRRDPDEFKHAGHAMVTQLKEASSAFKKNPNIAFLMLSVSGLSAFVTTQFFYIQNYMKQGGATEATVGVILSIASIVSAFAGAQAYRLRKWKESLVLRVLPAIMVVGFLLVGYTDLEILGFVIVSAMEGVLYVMNMDYLNKRIPSDQRATLLSFDSMAHSLVMIGLFPLVGWLGDQWGLKFAFSVSAVIVTLVAGWVWIGASRLDHEHKDVGE